MWIKIELEQEEMTTELMQSLQELQAVEIHGIEYPVKTIQWEVKNEPKY